MMVKYSGYEHLVVPIKFREITNISISSPTVDDSYIYITTKDQATRTGLIEQYHCYKFNTRTSILERNLDTSIISFFLNRMPTVETMALYIDLSTTSEYAIQNQKLRYDITVTYLDENLATCDFKFKITANTLNGKYYYIIKNGSLFLDHYYLNLAPDGNYLEYNEDETIMIGAGDVGGLTGESIKDNSINGYKKIQYKTINDTCINDSAIIARHLNTEGLSTFKITNFDCTLPSSYITFDGVDDSYCGYIGTTKPHYSISNSKFITSTEDPTKKYSRILYYAANENISGSRELATGMETHTQLTNKFDYAENYGLTASADTDPTDTFGADRIVTKDFETGSIILTNKPNTSSIDGSKGEVIFFVEKCNAIEAVVGIKAFFGGRDIPQVTLNLENTEVVQNYTLISDQISLQSDTDIRLFTNNTSQVSGISNDVVLDTANDIIINATREDNGNIGLFSRSANIYIGDDIDYTLPSEELASTSDLEIMEKSGITNADKNEFRIVAPKQTTEGTSKTVTMSDSIKLSTNNESIHMYTNNTNITSGGNVKLSTNNESIHMYANNTNITSGNNINLSASNIYVDGGSTDLRNSKKSIEQLILDVTRPVGSYYIQVCNPTSKTLLDSEGADILFNKSTTLKSTWVKCYSSDSVTISTEGTAASSSRVASTGIQGQMLPKISIGLTTTTSDNDVTRTWLHKRIYPVTKVSINAANQTLGSGYVRMPNVLCRMWRRTA